VLVLIGALSAILILGLVGLGALNLLRRQAITPTPPFIAGLAPTQPISGASQATPTIPPVVTMPPTVTPIPSSTPAPKPPEKLSIGGFAKIINTDGFGASVRAGPGTNNARLTTVDENGIVEIKDGPRETEFPDDATEYPEWWFVGAPDGIEGWVATSFMEPSLGPGY
jgi:hypothetical protein